MDIITFSAFTHKAAPCVALVLLIKVLLSITAPLPPTFKHKPNEFVSEALILLQVPLLFSNRLFLTMKLVAVLGIFTITEAVLLENTQFSIVAPLEFLEL